MLLAGWWAPKRKHADQISEKRVMWQIITNRNLLLSHKNTVFKFLFHFNFIFQKKIKSIYDQQNGSKLQFEA